MIFSKFLAEEFNAVLSFADSSKTDIASDKTLWPFRKAHNPYNENPVGFVSQKIPLYDTSLTYDFLCWWYHALNQNKYHNRSL